MFLEPMGKGAIATRASKDIGCAIAAHARTGRAKWQVAQIGRTGLLQLLRGTG